MIDRLIVKRLFTTALCVVVTCTGLATTGCWLQEGPEVVVYAALDREFSEPILKQFEQESGIRVLANYDVESTKSVGLTSRLMAERRRPRCDLFWNNEILNTLRLERQGILDAYTSPQAEHYPQQFVSPRGHWHGFAARVRVLIVNTEKTPPEDWPDSIHDLCDPRWRGRVGIAKPLAGTTATHAACLFSAWGDEKAERFFTDLKQNAKVLSGNKQVAQAVARGELAFGLIDTDDAMVEKTVNGMPVEIVFPDQGDDQIGALFVPNTLAVIKGGPNPQAARRLVDFLLAPQVEEQLARGASAQFPLNSQAVVESAAAPDKPLKQMQVDFQTAAEKWETAAEFLTKTFATAH